MFLLIIPTHLPRQLKARRIELSIQIELRYRWQPPIFSWGRFRIIFDLDGCKADPRRQTSTISRQGDKIKEMPIAGPGIVFAFVHEININKQLQTSAHFWSKVWLYILSTINTNCHLFHFTMPFYTPHIHSHLPISLLFLSSTS